jgi:hypothetical protein
MVSLIHQNDSDFALTLSTAMGLIDWVADLLPNFETTRILLATSWSTLTVTLRLQSTTPERITALNRLDLSQPPIGF